MVTKDFVKFNKVNHSVINSNNLKKRRVKRDLGKYTAKSDLMRIKRSRGGKLFQFTDVVLKKLTYHGYQLKFHKIIPKIIHKRVFKTFNSNVFNKTRVVSGDKVRLMRRRRNTLSTHYSKMSSNDKPIKSDIAKYTTAQKSRPTKGKGTMSYKCDECRYVTIRKGDLVKHKKKIHSGSKPFKCEICEYSCSRKDHLTSHMVVHSTGRPYKCDKCDYAGKRKPELKRHLLTHEEKPFNFKCDMCSFESNRAGSIAVHLRTHSQLYHKYKCDVCDYRTSHKHHFINHQRTHTKEKPHKCTRCQYACIHLGDFNTHMRMHTGEKPYKCDSCKYAAIYYSELTVHKRIHTGEKPFQCDQCDYAANKSYNLVRHKRRIHIVN